MKALLHSNKTCKLSSDTNRHLLGFTLIEILVVLFIISIVTSIVLLSISRNENKKIEAFANDLTQLLTLAEEQAMLQPAILGIAINSDTFQFASFQSVNAKKKAWVILNDKLLGRHVVPNYIYLEVKASNLKLEALTKKEKEDDDAEKFNPQIIISNNGDITPFDIYVGKRGEKAKFVITGEADGTITNKALY